MEIRFRLIGGAAPAGRLGALDLSRISGALHELCIRVGREQVHSTGPGRSRRSVEELNAVTLTLSTGSTVIDADIGPPDVLPLELDEVMVRDQTLLALLASLADDVRPEGVPDLVADSVGDLVHGLRSAAREVEITAGDTVLRFRTDHIHRDTWATPRRSLDDVETSISGWLEKVDIHSHELRIRDDVGNTLNLLDVVDDLAASALLGARVIASGQAVRGRDGRLLGVQSPAVTPFTSVVPQHGPQERTAWPSIQGPDPDGGVDLTDDEFASFLQVIGR